MTAAGGPPGQAPLGLARAFALTNALEEQAAEHRAELVALLEALMEVMDSFDRLLGAGPGDGDDPWASVALTARQLEKALRGAGLEPMGQLGEAVDPTRHQVRGVRPAAPPAAGGGGEEETVVEVVQRGYTLRGRVLRPTLVDIVSGASEEEE